MLKTPSNYLYNMFDVNYSGNIDDFTHQHYHIVGLRRAGHVLGFGDVIGNSPRRLSALCVNDVVNCYFLSNASIQAIMELNVAVGVLLQRALANTIWQTLKDGKDARSTNKSNNSGSSKRKSGEHQGLPVEDKKEESKYDLRATRAPLLSNISSTYSESLSIRELYPFAQHHEGATLFSQESAMSFAEEKEQETPWTPGTPISRERSCSDVSAVARGVVKKSISLPDHTDVLAAQSDGLSLSKSLSLHRTATVALEQGQVDDKSVASTPRYASMSAGRDSRVWWYDSGHAAEDGIKTVKLRPQYSSCPDLSYFCKKSPLDGPSALMTSGVTEEYVLPFLNRTAGLDDLALLGRKSRRTSREGGFQGSQSILDALKDDENGAGGDASDSFARTMTVGFDMSAYTF